MRSSPYLLIGLRVIFYSTSAEDLFRFRLPVARYIAEAGYSILFVSPDGPHAGALNEAPFSFLPIGHPRNAIPLLDDVWRGQLLARVYRETSPDIVHHFGLDAVVHGGIAAHKARLPWIVHSIPGLGPEGHRRSWMRPGPRFILRKAMKDAEVTVQSVEDRHLLVAKGCTRPEFVHLIGDEVVDPERIAFSNEPVHDPVAVLVGPFDGPDDLLPFVDAAQRLRRKKAKSGSRLRFAVVASIADLNDETRRRLEAWQEAGVVEWWPRDDVLGALRNAHVIVARSCKSYATRLLLLAAGAMGRPTVGVDLHWCRTVIRDGVTGLLVRHDDPNGLDSALSRILSDRELRRKLGRQARSFVQEEYSARHIARQIMGVYERLFERGREI